MAKEPSPARGLTASKTPRMQELFLPIHGHVALFPEEIGVIDHPSFQRLRRVRQLGFAHIVFPGAVHSRLEHSIGAVHVAQSIIDHVNDNFRWSSPEAASGDWRIIEINDGVTKLIRLGALLHDVGHLPFGHTLEDELNHLRSHDGPERLEKIGKKKFKHHDLDQSLGEWTRPDRGWSLEDLVNVLYKQVISSLQIDLEPFAVLCAIICKAPKDPEAKKKWDKTAKELDGKLDLQVCRDIVGNTICADFLDYLFRDWYHIGKPLYEDKRLYQYMEARTKTDSGSRPKSSFVINVGPADRIRHDALTNILELLEGRYKLAETVLFHRTKLAVTALLDRCLLDIRDLYRKVGISDHEFSESAEDLLLNGSDDALADILLELAAGGSETGKSILSDRIESDRKKLAATIKRYPADTDLLTPDLGGTATTAKTEIETQIDKIALLIDRLKNRCVYTLAYKLKISDFTGAHNPEHPRLNKLIELYKTPNHRHFFLQGMEARCNLPAGSLIMYCPPNAAMNAKVAEVNLFVDGEVTPFHKYDKGGEDASLTCGALWAHIRRFYELWSAQVYVERATWDSLTLSGKRNLRATLKEFFFQMRPDVDPIIVRDQVDASISAILAERALAARDESMAPELEKFDKLTFPSGLAFSRSPITK